MLIYLLLGGLLAQRYRVFVMFPAAAAAAILAAFTAMGRGYEFQEIMREAFFASFGIQIGYLLGATCDTGLAHRICRRLWRCSVSPALPASRIQPFFPQNEQVGPPHQPEVPL